MTLLIVMACIYPVTVVVVWGMAYKLECRPQYRGDATVPAIFATLIISFAWLFAFLPSLSVVAE